MPAVNPRIVAAIDAATGAVAQLESLLKKLEERATLTAFITAQTLFEAGWRVAHAQRFFGYPDEKSIIVKNTSFPEEWWEYRFDPLKDTNHKHRFRRAYLRFLRSVQEEEIDPNLFNRLGIEYVDERESVLYYLECLYEEEQMSWQAAGRPPK